MSNGFDFDNLFKMVEKKIIKIDDQLQKLATSDGIDKMAKSIDQTAEKADNYIKKVVNLGDKSDMPKE